MKRIVSSVLIMVFMLVMLLPAVNAAAVPSVEFTLLTSSAVKARTVNCNDITDGKIMLSIYDSNGALVDSYTKDFDFEVTFSGVNLSQKKGTAKLLLWQDMDTTMVPLAAASLKSFDFTNDGETETVNIDSFDSINTFFSTWSVEYINQDGSYAETGRIANDAEIIYNGVSMDEPDLDMIFGEKPNSNSLICPDTAYSGQLVLSRSNAEAEYFDTVSIEIGVSAVADEGARQGWIAFSDITVPFIQGSSVRTKMLSAINCINKDVTVVKDGVTCDYSEIKGGDVITVLWNGQDNIYTVNVLGTGSYVDGYVASEITKENKYKIGGTWYKAAKGSSVEGDIKLSSSGRFYIDAYGKIAALDDTVEVDGAGGVTTGNYAYVLAAATEADAWGDMSVTVQLLDKSGKVCELKTAESVTLENFDVKDRAVLKAYGESAYSDKATVDVADYNAGASALARALKGNLITYSTNAKGEIKTITMPTTDYEDKFFIDSFSSANVDFDKYDMSLGNLCDVDDKTVVFVINADNGDAVYDDADVTLSTTKSVVKTSSFFSHEQTYTVYAFDIDYSSGVAGAVVVLNEEAGYNEETGGNEGTGDEDSNENSNVLNSYAYVLNAVTEADAWDDMSVTAQLLDKSGKVCELKTAESVTLENFDVKDTDVLDCYSEYTTVEGTKVYSDKAVVDVADYNAGASALAKALKGNLITYSTNAKGEIKTITMPTTDDEDSFFIADMYGGEANFNKYDMSLGKLCDVDDKTVVFVINANGGSAVYDDTACSFSKNGSFVETAEFFSHGDAYNSVYAFDIDSSGAAGAVVVMNGSYWPDADSHLAVINSVYPTLVDDEIVYTVEYYMNGSFRRNDIDSDRVDIDGIIDAECGDVYKFKICNGVIKACMSCLVFGNGDKAYDLDAEKTPHLYEYQTTLSSAAEDAYFAAVIGQKKSGSYTVVKADDFTSNVTFNGDEVALRNIDNPNVYVYNPSGRRDGQLSMGSFYDITVEDAFFDSNYVIYFNDTEIATPAYGMADYVFVREYDGDVTDVIIYKNYEKIINNYYYDVK